LMNFRFFLDLRVAFESHPFICFGLVVMFGSYLLWRGALRACDMCFGCLDHTGKARAAQGASDSLGEQFSWLNMYSWTLTAKRAFHFWCVGFLCSFIGHMITVVTSSRELTVSVAFNDSEFREDASLVGNGIPEAYKIDLQAGEDACVWAIPKSYAKQEAHIHEEEEEESLVSKVEVSSAPSTPTVTDPSGLSEGKAPRGPSPRHRRQSQNALRSPRSRCQVSSTHSSGLGSPTSAMCSMGSFTHGAPSSGFNESAGLSSPRGSLTFDSASDASSV